MNNQNLPVNHHYIPQFIIKNFYADDGLLHSFSIQYDKVNQKRYSAKRVCFEKHAHSIEVKGEIFLEIENLYSSFESQLAIFIRKIQEPEYQFIQGIIPQEVLEKELPEFLKITSFLLSFFYWRLPANKILANGMRSKMKKIYQQYNIYGNEFELEKPILLDIAARSDDKERENFSKKIIQYFFLPILFSKVSDAIRSCKFVRTKESLILSDNPIICSFDNKTYDFVGDIYIPLSPNLCLTNAPEKIEIFQKQVFRQAKNIVMANSLDVLQELQEKSK